MTNSEYRPEILADINYLDLGFISGVYRDHHQLCFASACAANGFKIRHLSLKCNINFMSPCELWKENGTFFVITEFEKFYEIGIFTPYKENVRNVHNVIYTSLCYARTLKKSRYEKPFVFKAIHYSLHYIIRTYIRTFDLEVMRDERFYIFKLDKEAALRIVIHVPEGVQMRPLRRENVLQIIKSWPYENLPAPDYVKTMIKVNGGYGIFSRSTGELVSWGLKTNMGTIDFVQTKLVERRKKNASTIVKMLAVELARENQHPVALLKLDNPESYSFFEKLGFKNVGICHDVYINSKTPMSPMEETVPEPLTAEGVNRHGRIRQNSETDRLGTGPFHPNGRNRTSPFKRSLRRQPIPYIFKMKNLNIDLLSDALETVRNYVPAQNSKDSETVDEITSLSSSSSSTGTSEDRSIIGSDCEIEDNGFPTETQPQNFLTINVINPSNIDETLSSNVDSSRSNGLLMLALTDQPSTSHGHLSNMNKRLIMKENSPMSKEDPPMTKKHDQPSTSHRPSSPNTVMNSSGTSED